MSLHYDPTWCTGCQACQMACLDQCDIRPQLDERFLCRIEPVEKTDEISFRFIHCTQCGQCAAICPTGCLYFGEQGIVKADMSLCSGCRACSDVCPDDLISFHSSDGTVQKCDWCFGRVTAELLPACVRTCPTGALTWIKEE